MILIVGAGGHGHVVADILRAAGGITARDAAFVDDALERRGRTIAGYVVLGSLAQMPMLPHDSVIVAVGDNATRAALYTRFQAAGERFAVAVHPRSIVASDVTIGEGATIAAGAIVNPASAIGRNVIVNTGATVDHHSHVADHVHIAPGVHMGGEVHVGEGALVGIGATVLPGVTIGAWSKIGAGAVVTRDVPGGATVVGVPARVISRRLRSLAG